MQLPLESLTLFQTRWKSILDPILANPLNDISILKNVRLAVGTNQIPHLLQQMQQGWFLTDLQGVASIYRNQPFNDVYLYLNSSAAVTVSIGVF